VKTLALLGAFAVRRFGMFVRGLCVLLGLGRVILALGMIIPAVSVGSGPMGLCCRFVVFRRLVVCVFHIDFPYWPTNLGCHKSDLNSGCSAWQSCS
jgi:hypothetical protein